MRFTLQIFALLVGVCFGPSLLLLGCVLLAHPSPDTAVPALFLTLFIAPLVTLVAVLAHIRKSEVSWQEIGICKGKRSLWHLLWQLPIVIAIPPIVQMLVTQAFDPNASPPESSLDKAATSGEVPLGLLFLAVISYTIVTPILEEIVFRGVLMRQLGTRFGPVLTVGISAAIFMAVHLAFPLFPALLACGLLWGLLRLWHGNLWASMIAHIVNNTLATATVISLLFLTV
ncbi:CPBP family intramembrane metalloprotease [Corynebacterium hindlerae]|uniref:CPBP family intramembrane metalloprotease n=1 Tax=Corynebacterium hindlerae TaxID=699041 RepID=A0A7G5FBY4_9CORY|nr:type II CAAX endopeptidase family protein [Corynebacterium hindlerae]QMV84125.1 CPBP family intramembrane metalloprotease [Corynebacterium hindlerae]